MTSRSLDWDDQPEGGTVLSHRLLTSSSVPRRFTDRIHILLPYARAQGLESTLKATTLFEAGIQCESAPSHRLWCCHLRVDSLAVALGVWTLRSEVIIHQ